MRGGREMGKEGRTAGRWYKPRSTKGTTTEDGGMETVVERWWNDGKQ